MRKTFELTLKSKLSLVFRNMSTYEYIVRGRERTVVNDMNSDIESALDETAPPPPLKVLCLAKVVLRK